MNERNFTRIVVAALYAVAIVWAAGLIGRGISKISIEQYTGPTLSHSVFDPNNLIEIGGNGWVHDVGNEAKP